MDSGPASRPLEKSRPRTGSAAVPILRTAARGASGGKKAILQIVLDDMDRLLFGGRVFALRRDFFPLVANGSSRSCVGTTLAANNADKEPQAPYREGR
jgi:hypothetical protein